MRAIFISYRRSDAEGQAGRLFRDLADRFGNEAVFIDVAGMKKGRDFRRVLDEQLASCGVFLALIGENWLNAVDEDGKRRLDNSRDLIRLEIASALKRDIPVIPVLVQRARLPRETELPDDLKELVYREGVELTHARWDSDVHDLINALVPYVDSSPLRSLEPLSLWQRRVFRSLSALAAVVGLGFVLLMIYKQIALQQATTSVPTTSAPASPQIAAPLPVPPKVVTEPTPPPPAPSLRPPVAAKTPPSPVAPREPADAARQAIEQITSHEWAVTTTDALARRLLATTPLPSLEAAAAGGDVRAQMLLAAAYFFGIGSVQKDEAEAVRLGRLAAAKGDARGQNFLGLMYRNGNGGLPKDDVEAVRLFRLAVGQGLAVAQANLGYMYENGRGVAKDDVEAVRLYRLAASQGFAGAQFALGYMYENGRGLEANRAEAVRSYRLAARQGHSGAQDSLRRLGETW